MSDFTVAALVMAHKNAEQLARLIDRLSHPDVDVFLHLDSKWDLSPAEIDALCARNEGRVYLSRRVSVEPMTWLSLQAELVLIERALAEREYGYLMLLSGQDYPIRPIGEIVAHLAARHPRPYLDTTLWHEGNWVAASFGTTRALKSSRARFRRMVLTRVKSRPLGRALRGLNHVVALAASRVKRAMLGTPIARMGRHGLQAAGGSQWWVLPADMAAAALEASRDRRLTTIIKNVGAQDETFFQTALVNSAYADRLTINRWDETRQMGHTYTDFPAGSGHPRLLGVESFDALAASDFLFARKFDVDHDVEVLDLIDAKLLGYS